MRFLRFKRWLNESSSGQRRHQRLYFEEVRRHAGVDAAHAYGGFMGHLTAWCEHHQIPYQGVPVGTIKKHATGKGNAGKDEMIVRPCAWSHPSRRQRSRCPGAAALGHRDAGGVT
jgi:hypothetical protein